MQWVRQVNVHKTAFVRSVILLSALPSVYILSLWVKDKLGINPFETLIEFSGQWCVNFLILTLSITPARQFLSFTFKRLGASYGHKLSHWSFLFLARKSLGNYTLFYGVIHAWVYFYLELSWDWIEAGYDIIERPFIAFGVVAFVALTVLGATSPRRIQHALGHYWRKIHFLVYAVAVVVIIHVVLEKKPNTPLPWVEIIALAALLSVRLIRIVRRIVLHRRTHQGRLTAR